MTVRTVWSPLPHLSSFPGSLSHWLSFSLSLSVSVSLTGSLFYWLSLSLALFQVLTNNVENAKLEEPSPKSASGTEPSPKSASGTEALKSASGTEAQLLTSALHECRALQAKLLMSDDDNASPSQASPEHEDLQMVAEEVDAELRLSGLKLVRLDVLERKIKVLKSIEFQGSKTVSAEGLRGVCLSSVATLSCLSHSFSLSASHLLGLSLTWCVSLIVSLSHIVIQSVSLSSPPSTSWLSPWLSHSLHVSVT